MCLNKHIFKICIEYYNMISNSYILKITFEYCKLGQPYNNYDSDWQTVPFSLSLIHSSNAHKLNCCDERSSIYPRLSKDFNIPCQVQTRVYLYFFLYFHFLVQKRDHKNTITTQSVLFSFPLFSFLFLSILLSMFGVLFDSICFYTVFLCNH